jgi:hypothetical protein
VLALALTALLAASDVSIQVEVPKPLEVRRGELKGVISVRIKNTGAAPIRLRHRDVHGLLFTPEKGGAPSLVFHSCDCGFELGIEPPLERRTLLLEPRQEVVLRFDDFACGGGPHRAPPKGRYKLTYEVTVVASEATPERKAGPLDLKECERLVLSKRGLESAAIAIDVK